MPDDPSVQEEIAAVRAANARLREVVEARDAENAVLRSQLDACQAQMEGLRAELEALRARPGQNPRNSSRPPSSEGPGKPSPRSLRGKSGRKPGRPKGQPGATLEMTGRPDLAVPHEPAWCSGCRAGLSGAEVAGIERRQVTGLPEVIRALVTEHRIISRRCSRGTVTAGSVPAGVRAPVQYGHRITAVCAYLRHGQFLSRQRTCQAVTELFGVPVSPGTVAGMIRRAAGSPDGCLEVIRAAVTAAGVAHSDETGFRAAGKLAWVRSASAGDFALITVHPRRGRTAMDAAGVLPAFGGVAVHDARAPYDTYPEVTHALCNAHALRELQAVTDAAPPGQWCRAAQAADALREMKRLTSASLAARGTLAGLGQAELAAARHRCHSALLIGKQRTAARAGPLMRKHHALARRLLARENDYLRFATDSRVPSGSNPAEREIRMSKLRIKVSGCMRSMTGAQAFCAIRSCLSTAAKHQIGMLDALTQAAAGTAWTPKTA